MAPDTLSLEGKVAIITGSGRENGIGGQMVPLLLLTTFLRNQVLVLKKSLDQFVIWELELPS